MPVHNVNCSALATTTCRIHQSFLQPACCACCNNFVICGLYAFSDQKSGCNRLISLTNDSFSRVSYPLWCHWLKCRRKPGFCKGLLIGEIGDCHDAIGVFVNPLREARALSKNSSRRLKSLISFKPSVAPARQLPLRHLRLTAPSFCL